MTVHYWITKHVEDDGSIQRAIISHDYFAHDKDGAEMLVQQIVDEIITPHPEVVIYNWNDNEVTLKGPNQFIRVTISPAFTEEEAVAAGWIDPPTTLNREAWGDILLFEESR